MYLKKLTLRGFKSFASATSLVFEPGITCIVGPNGSGKSNVVDALAWVMGEQGAKSLRGASMEDVIFAGTSSRAPLGRAEIQLTIDNSDGALPIDYSEVTISRTKFRNGSSEYAINGTACRLLDVRELLSDSGMGREMHVIASQGHLDQILAATPETRRGLIEEAAGVLKHRERKEKALRKLEATEANLHRLTDLISEIRRQLKPLGRQAEVAKRASQVQADARDARARLLADDLAQATSALAGGQVGETDLRLQRQTAEAALAQARTQEDESRSAMATADAAYRLSQETWFALSAVAERVRSVVTLAGERVRAAAALPAVEANPARDPQTLLAQAETIAAGEARLRGEIAARATALEEATAAKLAAETEAESADQAFELQSRASSARRESAARLSGQVAALRARVEAGAGRLAQLEAACGRSAAAAESAAPDLAAAQAELAAAEAAESQLASGRDQAQSRADQARAAADLWRDETQSLAQTKAGLTARAEALGLAQEARSQAAAWLASSPAVGGRVGPVASLVRVEPGYEEAVAAALGAAAEALVMADLPASVAALDLLRSGGHGRADLVVADPGGPAPAPTLSGSVRPVASLLRGDPGVLGALSHILGPAVLAESAEAARRWLEDHPEAVVVTPTGDRLTSWLVTGGSPAGQSSLQLASALAETTEELEQVSQDLARAQTSWEAAKQESAEAQSGLDQALQALRAGAGARAQSAERVSRLNQAMVLAQADADRRAEQLARARQDLDHDRAGLAETEARLATAQGSDQVAEPDPARRDQAAEAARKARSAEMEARLGLRTLEERARSLAGQAASLRQAAEAERVARAEADQRRQVLERQGAAAQAVAQAGRWLMGRVQASQQAAEQDRDEAGRAKTAAGELAERSRRQVRDLSSQLEALIDSAHREELARAQQKMRVDALAERAMAEVGLDVETLLGQYGPDQPVPLTGGDETAEPGAVPYVREEQLKRLRTAERDLQLLGKVNPLALEEFDAMQERHHFLASQLDDVKRTRTDLLGIVDEVDARVQEVFASAYADVEREFAATFARLFPGGEGRLVLTEPDQWLTTGVEVEARPAGKKVKRLSLLSGGERSLVAVCFLVALFKARPSPFYILDEVEAALDDTNLGRLLEIYDELRSTSQLLIITHQKRTMEIADTLYGITMGSDGTSTVVSQRLRED